MDYLAHHGIRGMKWGIRNYQNQDGSLTPAGRERYGSGLGHLKKTLGRYKTGSDTVKSIVGKKARFGVALAKAKADQYTNTGRYKFRQAKSSVSRKLRGEDANKNIELLNRRIQWDYKISRSHTQSFINHIAKRTYESVISDSNNRFKYRMSMGERYADAVKKLSLDRFYKGDSRRTSIGAASLTGFKYKEHALPEAAIGRRNLPGLARIRMR